MIDLSHELVLQSVAEHLDIEPEALSLEQELARDLGLDALDLVLVVLRLEEIEEAEFPIAALDDVETVGDLVVLVRGWSRLARVVSAPAAHACPARTSSAFQLRAIAPEQIRTRRTGTE
jgi:acyl carrier protein